MHRFYTDPVLVLDFQSLYPSMIIAYNYCYSTCLGRVQRLGKYVRGIFLKQKCARLQLFIFLFITRNEPFEFGCTQLLVPCEVIEQLIKDDLVNISPAGVVFAKPSVRTGILPQMLSEILNTRIMVESLNLIIIVYIFI